MNMTLSIIGIIGGLICAIADMLLDIKGKDNIKCGTNKMLDSNWQYMKEWRFSTSAIMAMIAVPMYSMGVISLGNQIGIHNELLGNGLKLSIFVGGMGGFFIHVFICTVPVIYKVIIKNNDFELADRVLNRAFKVVRVPFGVLYLVLMIFPTLIVCCSIVTGLLNVPTWFVLLNPVAFQLLGWLLRILKKEWFYEVPAICAASLGLAMFGVIGVMNLV